MKLAVGTLCTLSEHEMRWCAHVGIERRLEAKRLGRAAVYGAPGSLWDVDIEGYSGEFALHKMLGLYPFSALDFGVTDVAERYQVRTTRHANGSLLIHKGDSDDQWFVLLTGGCGIYRFAGCILGADAKREEWWQDRSGEGRPCYFVPQAALIGIEECVGV